MDYLRIEEDGSFNVVKGKDPETDQDLLKEVDDGTLSVIRYKGNCFEYLIVENLGAEEEEGEEEFDVAWNPVAVS